MLDPKLKEYMLGAYKVLGDYGYSTVLNMRKGKDHIPKQKELLEKRVKIWLILKVLYRHIDLNTTPPTLYRITEEEVNKFVRCLVHLGDLNDYPVFPSLIPSTKPIVIPIGQQGLQGIPGIDGSDAFIVVEPDDDEDEIVVDSVVVGDVTHYKISLNLYTAQSISASIGGGTLFEIGDLRDFNITISSTKGRDNLTSLVCTDGAIDALLQPLVNLVTLNGVSQPVAIVLPITNQGTNKTYTFQSNDGSTIKSDSASISFVYPFLYGSSDITPPSDYYLDLTKLIETKADRTFTLNGTDKYFFIGYPESYGSLTAIKDQNGFDVISGWTEINVNIDSANLDNNWTGVAYKFYRTTVKTTIANLPYTIYF